MQTAYLVAGEITILFFQKEHVYCMRRQNNRHFQLPLLRVVIFDGGFGQRNYFTHGALNCIG